MTAIPSHVAHSYNTIKSTSLFHFCSCFCKFSQFLLPNRKEEEKKKKKEKEYELSLSQYQGPTCHIENLISAEESKASTCQIHVVLADRSKIRVTITKLFFSNFLFLSHDKKQTAIITQ